MIRYKLVRIVDGHFLSANSVKRDIYHLFCYEYKVGKITEIPYIGVACYKRLCDANKAHHINEAMYSFNSGNPVAILRVQSFGRPVFRDDRYEAGGVYEGGVNYRKVKVLGVVKIIKGG